MPGPIVPVGHCLQSAGAALLTLACSCALVSVASAPAQAAADRAAPSPEVSVDAGIQPGDDFFAYANGGWLQATDIPAGIGKWGARNEIAELTRLQVATLLDDAMAAPPGSDARKVADFRAAWLNEGVIEARGMAPLRQLLRPIDLIHDKAGLTRYLGSELPADVDPLNVGVYRSAHILGLAVQEGNHGEKDHVAYLLQGGLGLPDREDYLGTDPGMQALRDRYQTAIDQVLARLGPVGDGAATTARRAQAVMALESAIARSHATREASADDHNADALWTRADFARLAPGMDWNAFFAASGLARQQSFVAWQPSALRGVAALVAQQPLQAWRDYLRIRVIAAHADVLPRALSSQAMRLRGVAAGSEQPGTRAQRALEATQSAMSDAVGKLYCDRHFPAEHKARVQAIVANVVAAFARRVEAAAWMTSGTKTKALTKLKNLYIGIGCPERWQDQSNLTIDAADAVGNLRRVARRAYSQAVARLGQPVDPTRWWIAPQWPGAVLIFQQTAYLFAGALLQPPKFDASASDAANYGAIGAIIGHDATHFVDALGAEYEIDGGQRRWWSDDDVARYRAATEPLVRQFSAYRPFPDVNVDGKLGLNENLADLGGLVAAFDAYRGQLDSRANDKDSLRRQDRQFFIGFARGWRAKYRDDALRAQAASDHAPENYRVWTVRNMDAWYEAFDVKPGQRMYLEPRERVRIW
jgi:predicted metalloendopeptidase